MNLADAKARPLLGAVLAGGRSARMGRDKAAIESRGETLGERAVRVLRDVCGDVVALGHGRGIPEDVERIPDATSEGPASGLLALLESGRARRYVVVAVDMPNVEPRHLHALLRALDDARDGVRDDVRDDARDDVRDDVRAGARDGALAACFVVDGGVEPLPLIIDGRALALVKASFESGERRLLSLVERLSPAHVVLSGSERGALANVNTPDDLAAHERSVKRTK